MGGVNKPKLGSRDGATIAIGIHDGLPKVPAPGKAAYGFNNSPPRFRQGFQFFLGMSTKLTARFNSRNVSPK